MSDPKERVIGIKITAVNRGWYVLVKKNERIPRCLDILYEVKEYPYVFEKKEELMEFLSNNIEIKS